jgi:DNA-binding NtrC family response regulator
VKFKLLIVDDEKNIREGLAVSLQMDGYDVETAAAGDEGWKRFQKGDIDLVITDLRMPGISGEELLKRISAESPGVPVIVLTGHGTVENAVTAMRNGAYDFLTKPVNLERLSLLVKRALQNRELALRHHRLEEELEHKKQFETIIGSSVPMRRVFDTISRAAPARASVLITGESGVGKELVADAIHELSPRKGKPLIKVHCAALAASLLESELFGHEKGAFTGANAQRKGRFELAHRGTIFLDEIGEFSPHIQAKLLRVLQERELERVGGTGVIKVDVRLIAATNRNLEEDVKAGRFRDDLYYRLNVFPLRIPPLRERKGDIVLLADHFTEKYAEKNNKLIKRISSTAIDLLTSYSWPGNVRELENCIERAVILSTDMVIHSYNLPPSLQSPTSTSTEPITTLEAALSRLEKELIVEALKISEGNMAAAARRLGITERRIGLRVHHYGINWRLYRPAK